MSILALIFRVPPSTAAILYLSNTWLPSVPATILTPPKAVPISVSRLDISNGPVFLRFTPTASLDITTILEPVKVIGFVPLKSNSSAVAFPLNIISPLVKFIFPVPSEYTAYPLPS